MSNCRPDSATFKKPNIETFTKATTCSLCQHYSPWEMANSEYEYTRLFERSNHLLPNTWIVVRIDGHGFHKLSAKYEWEKPNDHRALDLMNQAAQAVMKEMPDITLAYGESDEYSFIFHPASQLYERRESKLVSTVVSIFTAHYVHGWPSCFPDKPLTAPLPSFDSRAVVYPTLENLRDYLSWRQADCHVNNLYNTTFWTLVNRGGLSRRTAEKELSGTFSADKNELLFSRFGINYNTEAAIFRKGSVLYHDYYIPKHDTTQHAFHLSNAVPGQDSTSNLDAETDEIEHSHRPKPKSRIGCAHVDIIGKEFWEAHPWVLKHGTERKRVVKEYFQSLEGDGG